MMRLNDVLNDQKKVVEMTYCLITESVNAVQAVFEQ